MARKSDQSTTATEIRAAQAARLRRLREACMPVQADAALLAGISASSMNRMEQNQTAIDAVALARLCAGMNVPAEYVITGDLAGYPKELARTLLRLEDEAAATATPAKGRTVAPVDPAPERIQPGSRTRDRRKVTVS